MSIPAAFTSCLGPNGKSFVFYVDEYGYVKNWRQQEDSEQMFKQGRNVYDDVGVKRSANDKIKSNSKDLACLWLKRTISGKQVIQLRLYYLNDQSIISELCYDMDAETHTPVGRSTGGFWFDGGLTSKKWTAQANTPISAHFNSGPKDNSIKVYFLPGNIPEPERPTVAWITIKDGMDWQLLDKAYRI